MLPEKWEKIIEAGFMFISSYYFADVFCIETLTRTGCIEIFTERYVYPLIPVILVGYRLDRKHRKYRKLSLEENRDVIDYVLKTHNDVSLHENTISVKLLSHKIYVFDFNEETPDFELPDEIHFAKSIIKDYLSFSLYFNLWEKVK